MDPVKADGPTGKQSLTDEEVPILLEALRRASDESRAKLEPQTRAYRRTAFETAVLLSIWWWLGTLLSGWTRLLLIGVGAIIALMWLVTVYDFLTNPRCAARSSYALEGPFIILVVISMVAVLLLDSREPSLSVLPNLAVTALGSLVVTFLLTSRSGE